MTAPLQDDQLHILVIDDDEDMRELFCSVLLAEGHQVFAAGSAEEGLALLPYDTFQVAFLDHHLPGMEGLVFGEYLRRNNPHMKIALVTGSDDTSLAKGAEDHHITFVPKPFKPSQLYALIDEYKAEASARQARALEQASSAAALEHHVREHFEALPKVFEMPNVPDRIEDRLVREVKRSLSHLRTVARYNERDRVVAVSALLTMQVLGLRIPKGKSGRPLTEELDEILVRHGREPVFTSTAPAEDPR